MIEADGGRGATLSDERVLITGGAGFIGSALAKRWLSEGALVLVLDDFSAGNRSVLSETSDRLAIVRAGVEDRSTVRAVFNEFKPTVVYHLAALHYIPDCESDPFRAQEVNVLGTQSVLSACEATKPRRVLLASTSSVYVDSEEPLNEETLRAPKDSYGLTKAFAEDLVGHFHVRSGLSAVVCRFFNVYGPGDTIPHIIPEVFKQLAAGSAVLRLGNLSPRRDFIFIDDLVSALVTLHRELGGGMEAFNLGSGTDCTIEELVRQIVDVCGHSVRLEVDPSRVRRFERPRLAADISKVTGATSWRPRIDLADGLRRVRDSFPGLS